MDWNKDHKTAQLHTTDIQGSHADEEDGEGEGDDDIVIKTAADAQEGAGSDAEGAADQEEQVGNDVPIYGTNISDSNRKRTTT